MIKKAFSATEDSFLALVKKQWLSKPQIASVGSCCLVGVLCNGLLYVANVGDSRVVLGRSERATKEVIGIQLSTEHNAGIQSVREELRSLHPNDSQIVVLKHKVWRVKGLIQVMILLFFANFSYIPFKLVLILNLSRKDYYFPLVFMGYAWYLMLTNLVELYPNDSPITYVYGSHYWIQGLIMFPIFNGNDYHVYHSRAICY